MDFVTQHGKKAAFNYARYLTAEYSKSFYFSSKMLPKKRRWATYALYGFCRYADNLIDNPRGRSAEDIVHEVQFMSEELKVAFRTGESEHPILAPFIIVAKEFGIPIEYPLDLLKGVAMDVQLSRYETFDDLYTFCYRVAGVVGLMMTHVLGYKTKEAFPYAEKLGIAMQLTNILRDIQEDKNMDRIYLPLEELRRYDVTEDEILQEKFSARMRELVRFQVDRAHEYYEGADPGIKMLEIESQFAIYSASKIYRGLLRKIETRDYNPFLGRVFVPQRKKLGIVLEELLRTRTMMLHEQLRPSQ